MMLLRMTRIKMRHPREGGTGKAGGEQRMRIRSRESRTEREEERLMDKQTEREVLRPMMFLKLLQMTLTEMKLLNPMFPTMKVLLRLKTTLTNTTVKMLLNMEALMLLKYIPILTKVLKTRRVLSKTKLNRTCQNQFTRLTRALQKQHRSQFGLSQATRNHLGKVHQNPATNLCMNQKIPTINKHIVKHQTQASINQSPALTKQRWTNQSQPPTSLLMTCSG